MIRRPPKSTRTDTLVPYTSLFRSRASQGRGRSCLYLLAGGPAGMNRPAGNGCPGFRPGLPAAPSRGIKEPRRVAAHRRRKPLEPRMTEIVLHDIDQVLVDRIKRRSEERTSELQSLMRTSYAVLCLKN